MSSFRERLEEETAEVESFKAACDNGLILGNAKIEDAPPRIRLGFPLCPRLSAIQIPYRGRPMKAKITAPEHAALDPTLQGEYKPADDGTFDLNLEGAPAGFVAADQVTQLQSNTAGLNRKISELETERDQVKTQLTEAQAQQTADKQVVTEKTTLEGQIAQLAEQLKAQQARNEEADRVAAEARRGAVLTTASDEVFVKPASRAYVLWKAQQDGWTLDEQGSLSRPNVFSEQNPGQPQAIGEYMAALRTAEPDHFNQAQPSGPAPGDNGHARRRPGDYGRRISDCQSRRYGGGQVSWALRSTWLLSDRQQYPSATTTKPTPAAPRPGERPAPASAR